MSRLIDADKLIEDLKEYVKNIKNIRSDGKCFLTEENVLGIINNQPTAFDVDKVVEQLEELKDKAQLRRDELSTLKVITSEFIDKKGYERGRVYAFDDAIEIVKEGWIDE